MCIRDRFEGVIRIVIFLAYVMATALKDLYRTKKDVSIHGARVRWQVRLTKLLPHSTVTVSYTHLRA